MKKFIVLFATIAATLGFSTVVSAQTYEHAGVTNVVETIDQEALDSQVTSFEWDQTEDRVNSIHNVKFTVDQTSYVHIYVNSTVCGYGILGQIDNCAITSQTGKVVKTLSNGLKGEKDFYTVLEKGTYNLSFSGLEEKESYGKEAEGTVTTVIDAEKIKRSGNAAGTIKDPVKLVNGLPVVGYTSETTRSQYFKLYLTKKSEVSFQLNVAGTPSFYENNYEYKLTSANGTEYTDKITLKTTEGYNHYEAKLGQGWFYHMPTGGVVKLTLPAGTYTFKFDAKEGTLGEIKVTTKASAVKEKLAAPKLSKFKKGTKEIKGRAAKGATVKVKVGKKTYTIVAKKSSFKLKLKSKLKSKGKITVWALKKGYITSKKVTYKVK